MSPASPVFLSIPNVKEVIFAENQPQYLPLPAFKYPNGLVVTRWKFTIVERIKFLFSGNLWLSVHTFNSPLQPIRLELDEPIEE